VQIEGQLFENNRLNFFPCWAKCGSNPVASSSGGKLVFRAASREAIRATEFGPMLLIDRKFRSSTSQSRHYIICTILLDNHKLGGLKRRQLRAVLQAIALDVRGKRWQTLILT
jgi:hypothetical protein